jgi:DNA-binding MarR family transcriptional regulator
MGDGKATTHSKVPDEAPLSAGPSDDAALEAWRQLFLAFHTLRRRVEELLAPYGLALSQYEALARIGLRPGMVQQDLVPQLLVTKGNVGAMLDRLESGNLIERRPDPQDRRANRLSLTRTGKALVTELFEKRTALVHQMMGPLDAGQQKSLSDLLAKLVRHDRDDLPCSREPVERSGK